MSTAVGQQMTGSMRQLVMRYGGRRGRSCLGCWRPQLAADGSSFLWRRKRVCNRSFPFITLFSFTSEGCYWEYISLVEWNGLRSNQTCIPGKLHWRYYSHLKFYFRSAWETQCNLCSKNLCSCQLQVLGTKVSEVVFVLPVLLSD